MSDNRKMEIAWKTTPAELRMIASSLERDGCNQVRVNWYHTRLCFVLDGPRKKCPPELIELDGKPDGSISPEDIDTQTQVDIIEAAQYLSDEGLQQMADYLVSLRLASLKKQE